MMHTCISKDSNTTDAVCSAMTAEEIVPFTLCISHAHETPRLELCMHGKDCALCPEHVIQSTCTQSHKQDL